MYVCVQYVHVNMCVHVHMCVTVCMCVCIIVSKLYVHNWVCHGPTRLVKQTADLDYR